MWPLFPYGKRTSQCPSWNVIRNYYTTSPRVSPGKSRARCVPGALRVSREVPHRLATLADCRSLWLLSLRVFGSSPLQPLSIRRSAARRKALTSLPLYSLLTTIVLSAAAPPPLCSAPEGGSLPPCQVARPLLLPSPLSPLTGLIYPLWSFHRLPHH